MNSTSPDPSSVAGGFHTLIPDTVMGLAEEVSGLRCTGVCRPLNSYINRVYELGVEPEGAVVAKFYRPGRWDRAALEDELRFVRELADDEVPVVPPMAGADGALLHPIADMFYAVYPKMGGRIVDEPSAEQWSELGRLIGRAHVVGRRSDADGRVEMTPTNLTEAQIVRVADSGCIPGDLRSEWEETALALVDQVDPLFDGPYLQRIHGDLHAQNLIHRPGEGFHLIDFDDMAMGPAVQDLWMLLPGRLMDAQVEMRGLLRGYDTFLSFDRAELRLIEPLRFMRFVHYTAWCAMQAADGGFTRLAPDWGSETYWRDEIRAMHTQAQEIEDALEARLPRI